MTTKHFAPAAWHRPGSPLSLLCPSGLGLSRLGLRPCLRLGPPCSRGSAHGCVSQRWEGGTVDELALILQREIELSVSDIDMRTKLVRALSEYQADLKLARERLRSKTMAAFGVETRQTRGPTLDELEQAVRGWQAPQGLQ